MGKSVKPTGKSLDEVAKRKDIIDALLFLLLTEVLGHLEAFARLSLHFQAS